LTIFSFTLSRSEFTVIYLLFQTAIAELALSLLLRLTRAKARAPLA
jgi:hypothetical protein